MSVYELCNHGEYLYISICIWDPFSFLLRLMLASPDNACRSLNLCWKWPFLFGLGKRFFPGTNSSLSLQIYKGSSSFLCKNKSLCFLNLLSTKWCVPCKLHVQCVCVTMWQCSTFSIVDKIGEGNLWTSSSHFYLFCYGKCAVSLGWLNDCNSN